MIGQWRGSLFAYFLSRHQPRHVVPFRPIVPGPLYTEDNMTTSITAKTQALIDELTLCYTGFPEKDEQAWAAIFARVTVQDLEDADDEIFDDFADALIVYDASEEGCNRRATLAATATTVN